MPRLGAYAHAPTPSTITMKYLGNENAI